MFNIDFKYDYKKILECIYPEYGKDVDLDILVIKGDETILQEHIIDLYYRLVMLPKIEMLELIIDEHVQT